MIKSPAPTDLPWSSRGSLRTRSGDKGSPPWLHWWYVYIYYKYVKTIFQIWLHVPDPIEKIWLTQVWLNSPIDVSNYDSIIEPWIWGPSPIYWQTEFSWAQILHQLPYHFGIAMVTGLDHRYIQKNKLVDMGDSLWLTALMGFFTDFNGIL